MPTILGDGRTEDIEISGAEDERVEDLGDEGDTCIRQPMLQASSGYESQLTLSTAVGVYRPYEYELR